MAKDDWRRGGRSKPQSTEEKVRRIKKLRGNPGNPLKRGSGTVLDADMRDVIRKRQQRMAAQKAAQRKALGTRLFGGAAAIGGAITMGNVIAENYKRTQRGLQREVSKKRQRDLEQAGFRTDFKRGPKVAERGGRKTREQRAARARTTRPDRQTPRQGLRAVPTRPRIRVKPDVVPKQIREMNQRLDKIQNLTVKEALPMVRIPL